MGTRDLLLDPPGPRGFSWIILISSLFVIVVQVICCVGRKKLGHQTDLSLSFSFTNYNLYNL